MGVFAGRFRQWRTLSARREIAIAVVALLALVVVAPMHAAISAPAARLSAITLQPVTVAASAGKSAGKSTPVPKPPVGPPMRIVLVKSDDPACGDRCPDWISAEGPLDSETVAAFRKVLKSIGARKLPIFINSPGGNVDAAMAIGRLLRARHLEISVTRTVFTGCQPSDPKCASQRGFKGYRGHPTSIASLCASACPILVAGAEVRHVAWTAFVGVHEVTTFQRRIYRQYAVTTQEINGKKVVIDRKLVSEKVSDPFLVEKASWTNRYKREIAEYYREMGVSDRVVEIAFATKAADIHWLTRTELAETHMMTDTIAGEVLVGFSPVPQPVKVATVAPSTAPAKPIVAHVISEEAVPPSQGITPSLGTAPLPVLGGSPPGSIVANARPPANAAPLVLPPAIGGTLDPSGQSPAPEVTMRPVDPRPLPLSQPPAAPQLELAAVANVALGDAYQVDLLFMHYSGTPSVDWHATIRRSNVAQFPVGRAVQLEFPNGWRLSTLPGEEEAPPYLDGNTDVHSYCLLAASDRIRLHLIVPGADGSTLEEIAGAPGSLGLPKPALAECADLKPERDPRLQAGGADTP